MIEPSRPGGLDLFLEDPMADSDRTKDLHFAGVHAECRSGGGKYAPAHRRCHYAGKVERIHSHEFDGPLVCGCEDLANPL